MAECIEREATIKRIKEVYCVGCNSYNGVRCRACGIGDAIDMIEDAPTVDAVQKIPIVGEAVEVTEPDFTKSAAPEPRTVTVEELRALLEDACRDGLGECAVLVEGTAFADLWLDVHSTLRIYESGERTVELKGTAKSA